MNSNNISHIIFDFFGTLVKYTPGHLSGDKYYNIHQFLLEQRYKLIIISNTHYPSLIHRNLDAMGITDYFNLVVTSVEHGIRKPDARIFQDTLKQLSVSADKVVYVGDNMQDDYEGATKAGLRCILIDQNNKWKETIKDRVNSIFDIEYFSLK